MAAGLQLMTPVEGVDHVQGPSTAAITLVEYGDYECPHSAEAATIVNELRSRYADQLRLVFRHYPLSAKHPRAQPAAEAAEAAATQGRFWEMHRLLFVGQPGLDDEHLRDYAKQLYLDMVRFDAALAQHTHAVRVKRDVISGERSGVRGTPTYFINGKRHEGPDDLTGLVTAIEEALGRNRKSE